MNYREEIKAALKRDDTQYGQVFRKEAKEMLSTDMKRIQMQLDIMLEEKNWKTTLKEKKRCIVKMCRFAKGNDLSPETTEEIKRRAEGCIVIEKEGETMDSVEEITLELIYKKLGEQDDVLDEIKKKLDAHDEYFAALSLSVSTIYNKLNSWK